MDKENKTNKTIILTSSLIGVLIVGVVAFALFNNSNDENKSELNATQAAEVTSTPTSMMTPTMVKSDKTIAEIASSDPKFSTLVTALSKADLVDPLTGEDPLTVFAPTNEAFAKLNPTVLNDLVSNPAKKPILANILKYHVVSGEVSASQVVNLTSAKALNNTNIKISQMNGNVYLNENVKITQTDIKAKNGVIHVIDTVIINDPVDTLTSLGGFNSLATALTKADLVTTLKGDGPFTIFAPTDAAFAKVDPATLNALLNDPAKLQDLKKVLTYHVSSGAAISTDVVKLTQTSTVNGKSLPIKVENGSVILNGNSKVVITDIPVSNGVVHVIDTVLLP